MVRSLVVPLLHLAALSAASSVRPSRDINSIYEGCGDTKECYGYFSNSCVETMVSTFDI